MYSKSRHKIQYSLILLLIAHCSLLTAFAQSELGVPSITGKPGATTMLRNFDAIGVNPANLGWSDNNIFSIGLGDVSANLQSGALNFHEFSHAFISNNNSSNSENNSSNNSNNNSYDEQQNELTKLFINNNSINLNANITLIGLSLHIPKFGGISFSIRDRFFAHISADVTGKSQLDTLLKGGSNGPFISSVFKNTNLNIQYLREFNLAYGRKIKEIIPGLDLYGGIGYRYILGLANVNLNAENGIVTAETSLNNINYQNFNDHIRSIMYNTPGRGHAIDLGANAVFLNKLKFGLSLVNLGFIKWSPAQTLSLNTNMIRVDSLQRNVNTFDGLFNQNNLFYSSSSTTTWLPAKLRIGAGIKVCKLLEVGADIALPLNKVDGYKDKTLISLGGELNFFNFLKINSGVSGNSNIGWNIPLGITISGAGWYDIYFATNDILTITTGRTRNPMFSAAFGGIRFNIPARL